jgi:hypothetical protein
MCKHSKQSVESQENIQDFFSSNSKFPLCPYKHLICRKFNPDFGIAICQTHTNQYSKSVRCDWLPPCFPKKYHYKDFLGGH